MERLPTTQLDCQCSIKDTPIQCWHGVGVSGAKPYRGWTLFPHLLTRNQTLGPSPKFRVFHARTRSLVIVLCRACGSIRPESQSSLAAATNQIRDQSCTRGHTQYRTLLSLHHSFEAHSPPCSTRSIETSAELEPFTPSAVSTHRSLIYTWAHNPALLADLSLLPLVASVALGSAEFKRRKKEPEV